MSLFKSYYVYIASIIAVCVVSHPENCEYGSFSENDGKCMFDCESNGNYVEKSTLSFDFIREECGAVQNAARSGVCSSLSDLVYSVDYCGCPYCKCATQDLSGTIKENIRLGPRKTCYNCTCDSSTDSSISDLVYDCDSLMSTSSPYTWNLYSCPPAKCTDTSGGDQTTGGFWDTVDADEKCLRYCYCNKDGTKDCETGLTNIVNSKNDDLYDAFFRECDYYLKDCLEEPSRMVQEDVGPYCYSCPKCDCGTYTFGDSWYVEYQDFYDVQYNREGCALCECKESFDGNDYADCDDAKNYLMGQGSCPPDSSSSITCHEQNSASATVDTTSTASTCIADNNDDFIGSSAIPYCQWTVDFETGDNADDTPYEWDCGENVICEAFAHNKCITADLIWTTTNCWGTTETDQFKQHFMCCTSDNCNHENIDTSSCSVSSDFQSVLTDWFNCLEGDNSEYRKYECDDGDVDKITCADVRKLYAAAGRCYCSLYGDLYTRVGTATQAQIKQQSDYFFSTDSQWNDVLGCHIGFECNLEAGGVLQNNKGVAKVCVIGMLWTILVILAISN